MSLKSFTAGLGAVAIFASLAIVQAPVSGAVCGAVGGRHVAVGGCTHVPADIAVGVVASDDVDYANQAASGAVPCYTPSGQPYYTPGDMPCY
jgi:hypothetical protein